jgi:hypothetical protein
MFSWDDLVGVFNDYVKPVASAAWDVAKENPLATAGALYGGATDGWGGALKGGMLGYGADQLMGSNKWFNGQPGASAAGAAGVNPNAGLQMTQRPTSTAPVMAGVEGSPIASGASGNFGNYGGGNPNYYSSSPSNMVSDTSNYSNEGRSFAAPTAAPATTGFAGLMGSAKSGMGALKKLGAENGDLIKAGTGIYAGLKSQQAGDAYQQYLNQQGQQNSEMNARNTALTTEKVGMGREMADNARTNAAGAGVKAYAQGLAGAGRVARKQTTQGNKQRALIQGAGNASTAFATADQNARAGLAPAMSTAAGLMGPYATPTNTSNDFAAALKYRDDSQPSAYATVANDIFGLSKPKADEETDINRVKAG